MSKHALVGGLLSLALFSAGCVAPRGQHAEDFGVTRQREWNELKRLKGDLRWEHDEPRVFRFPGHGELTVRSWYLEGGPGWETVRAEFTYENTTGRYLEGVRVELAVVNGEGNAVSKSRVKLRHPWGLPLAPATFFSDEITVSTQGAHLDPGGWTWEIECIARPEGVATASLTF